MPFSSAAFVLGFLPTVLAGFFLLGHLAGGRAALLWLLAASLVFYGWDSFGVGGPGGLPLLVGSILGNLALGRHIRRLAGDGRALAARRWMRAGVGANLLALGWFKYAGFAAATLAALTGLDLPSPTGSLPLGISFFTFQQIMFLVDGCRGDTAPVPALPYAGFVACFAHLIAGPLVQPREIMPQLADPRLGEPRAEAIAAGCAIFLIGLAKKLVLADTFAGFADVGFDAAGSGATLSFFEAWYAALAFSLQIYFDFSGYSDMAIGLARMLNIDFPANFDSPYKALSIIEFWRRWHITLSRFLRDYVYIPLGGSRGGEWRRARNVMATLLLGGLWHGAGWTFVLWGGLHGAYLVAAHQFRRATAPAPARLQPIASLLAQALTLLAVVVAWVPFRAGDLAAAGSVLAGMAGWHGVAVPRLVVGLLPPLGALATPVPVLRHLGEARTLSFPELTACLALGWAIVLLAPNTQQLSERQRRWTLAGSFALTAQALFFAPGATPFLYFRF